MYDIQHVPFSDWLLSLSNMHLSLCHVFSRLDNSILFFPSFFFLFFFFFLSFLSFSRAAPAAHGGSQARGGIRAVASSLRQSHSNVGSGI